MSQSWVFRRDDYEKILHKIKLLSERIDELEKKQGKPERDAVPAATSEAVAPK